MASALAWVDDVMAAGEGIETMLSPRTILPTLPMVAALSASHLAALLFPPTLRRLYVVLDRDPAGNAAMASLAHRAEAAGIEGARPVVQVRRSQRGSPPPGKSKRFRASVRWQLVPQDVARFMSLATTVTGMTTGTTNRFVVGSR